MSINIDGPEGRNITGEFAENEIKAFFSNFAKWELIYENFDVKFLKKKNGKTKDENRGFDLLYKLYEPSELSKQGIVIECKKIKDGSTFSPSKLNGDIDTLKEKIISCQKSTQLYRDEKIKYHEIETYRYGILFYRFIKYDHNQYLKCLKKIQLSEKIRGSNFPVIFVISNDRISAFMHLKQNVKQTLGNEPIEFYYSPMNDFRKTNKKNKQLSLFNLFSDVIPFSIGNKNGVLTFDFPSIKSFKLIERFCSEFDFNISYIAFARNDYTQEHIYNHYKSECKDIDMANIELIYLNNDMNCSTNLEKEFI